MVLKTFKDYETTDKSLTIREMETLYEELLAEVGTDPEGMELLEDVVRAATEYAVYRSNWTIWNTQQKTEKDSMRSACHDMLMVNMNVLARYLRMQGRKVLWRDVLGYEEDDRCNRKRVGDFGMYIVFVNSLNAR
jgi:hypothetical protein